MKIKKISIFSIIPVSLIGSFFYLSAVLAVSGACSYHGGVDCNSGAGLSGEVVCKDGWRDSMVKFRDMEECKNLHACSTEESNNLIIQYNFQALVDAYKKTNSDFSNKQSEYFELKAQLQKELADFESKIHGRGITVGVIESQRNTMIENQISRENSKLSDLQLISKQLQLEKNKLQVALESINKDCYRLGEAKYLTFLENLNSSYSKNSSANSALNTSINCPANSYLSSNQCYCNIGFILNEKQTECIAKLEKTTESCKKNYGEHVSSNGVSCVCNAGYRWNKENTACVKNNKFVKTLKLGTKNNEVLELQKILIKNNLLKSKPTGFFGVATKMALIKFQKDHILQPTGIVDLETREVLNIIVEMGG